MQEEKQVTGREKPQLHQSHLAMASKCAIQFQRRYGETYGIGPENEIVPPGVAQIVGSSVHKSVERNLTSIIEYGSPLSVEEVEAIARDEFNGGWSGGVLLKESEAENLDETQGKAVDQSVALAGLHFVHIAPTLSPVAVEEKFVIELLGYPFDLAGMIDVREEFKGPFTEGPPAIIRHIRDTKTAAQKPNEYDVKDTQLAMYSMAHEVLHGSLPDRVYLDALVKTKTPKHHILWAVPDSTWINPLKHRIERFAEVMESVRSGKIALLPCNSSGPAAWVCSKSYCGYAETCKFWSGRE